jgi:hypothetical protein
MAVSIGGGIVKDGLIFHYNTRSKQTFRGYPTENLAKNVVQGTQGTNVEIDDLPEVRELEKLVHIIESPSRVNEGTADWLDIKNSTFSPGISVANGEVINVSLYIYIYNNITNRFNCQLSLTGYNTNLGIGGSIIGTHDLPTNTWQRLNFYWINSTGSTQTLASVRVECYTNEEWDNGTVNVYGANYQVEVTGKTFPSPYSDGTRTISEVLYDATGKNTITATDLIYNSDGTVSYDGTTGDQRCVINAGTELNALKGSSAITVEAWVYYTSYSGGSESYSVITNSGYPWVWLLENPSQRLRFRAFIGGSDVNVADPDTHALNTWYHVVGTYNGANHILYVNGVEKANRADTGVLGSPSYGAFIGTYQGTNYCMSGKIDDVKIYNVALTAKQVKQNFEAGRHTYGI